ncbi:hypothetical protein EMO89_01490 [Bifidobacterium tissieri]|uniref:Uncharacterized protein n=1 Tax=Bifidobacterium tissieri TaxID=1630162 RepID=A0A5M9ZUU8_9BIFI|nr:hypothetical protein [Bifidobacterium tissieri]KAA8831437.1 hypothetical protein EMO89_01490 [Bifidobacterium tissieri]
MATKVEWSPTDYAAQEELLEMIQQSGYSYRVLESKTDIGISFARIRDIALGKRAPVRLSEFIAICQACRQDPVSTLRRIIQRAETIKAPPAPAINADDEQARIEETLRRVQQGDMTIVADHDPLKQQYIDHGDGDDPA